MTALLHAHADALVAAVALAVLLALCWGVVRSSDVETLARLERDRLWMRHVRRVK